MKRSAYIGWTAMLFASCGGPGASQNAAPTPVQEVQSDIVRGSPESGFPQVVLLEAQLTNGGRLRCSGSYVGPRLVLTAAHCVRPALLNPNGILVYYGNDFATDRAQLTSVPAPGEPSVWARSDSWQQHPNYQAALNYPDLAVVYLDRDLPFDPLPIFSGPVAASWIGKQAEIVGWGGSKAITADISQVEGSGVKRSGFATIAGSPTASDFHSDDPNPGILDPAIRANEIKLDGQDPNANPCAGDSGSPMIITSHGVKFVAGVSFWTGLFCEDYGMYMRLDPFKSFLRDALDRTGKEPIIPRLQCLDHRPDGALRAYFDYLNENGVSITIPYGKNSNDLALDTGGARPTQFAPGDHSWVFGVTFPADQCLKYKLSSPHGVTSVVHVDAQSTPACSPGVELACAHSCDAAFAVDCPSNEPVRYEDCVAGCVQTLSFFPTCGAQWISYNECVGRLSPDPSNWFCDPDFPPPLPSDTVCVDEITALDDCITGRP
jgi:hypothetical protein